MILCDDPGLADLLGPSPGAVRERAARDLPEGDRALHAALGGGSRVWVTEGVPGWGRLFAVREASGSQFDVLRGLLAGGFRPAGPTACLALAGSGFHGHRGRPWAVLEGNLHLCALLAPESLPAADAVRVVALPAVATARAVERLGGDRLHPAIKWVNDILIDDAKVAGVLSATQTTGEGLDALLFGVGLNVARTPAVPPTPFVPRTTSLAEERGSGAPDLRAAAVETLRALLEEYELLLRQGCRALLDRYRERSSVTGRRVRVYPEGIEDGSDPAEWPEPIAAGRVAGIRADLALHIEGVGRAVDRGRLAFEDACRRFGMQPPPLSAPEPAE